MALSENQLRQLATICADIGQVALASIAIPFFLDTFSPRLALLGVATAAMFWIASLLLINVRS